jgi:DNA-binding NarL/FixJ family response regulator
LELLAQGLTNVEIVERLFISPVTVRNHVSRILAKLQVRDRREGCFASAAADPHIGE